MTGSSSNSLELYLNAVIIIYFFSINISQTEALRLRKKLKGEEHLLLRFPISNVMI
jgi:hypothetical protein